MKIRIHLTEVFELVSENDSDEAILMNLQEKNIVSESLDGKENETPFSDGEEYTVMFRIKE